MNWLENSPPAATIRARRAIPRPCAFVNPMPIYEFECRACGERFERLQKLSDADPTDCPVCARAEVQRRLTAPSFRLAGSGWYETDFKKEGDKKRNLAEKGDAAAAPKAESAAPACAPAGCAKPDCATTT